VGRPGGARARGGRPALVIESHFQLDGYTTLARGARAIVNADGNLHDSAHHDELVRIFHRRGIGPVV